MAIAGYGTSITSPEKTKKNYSNSPPPPARLLGVNGFRFGVGKEALKSELA